MGVLLEFHAVGSRLNLNALDANRKPRRFSSIEKIWKYSAGIYPSVFQLLTADIRTPATFAVAPLPPSAAITSPTDLRTIPNLNSRNMEKSSVHNSEIENPVPVKLAVDMGRRDGIMARLRQLPHILNKTDAEIAEACGISPSQWSNYKSESASENIIRPMVALELWNTYGVPMEWVYDGQTTRAEPEMRAKLAQANRRADAWLVSRGRPRPRGPLASIAILVLAGAFLFGGCATAGPTWKRVDGFAVDNEHIQAAKLACEGEASKANMAAGSAGQYTILGYSQEMRTVYVGCMADRGYLPGSP